MLACNAMRFERYKALISNGTKR